MPASDSRVDRSASVSSMRRMNVPSCAAREQPVEQRRARVADVQLPGRAGAKRTRIGSSVAPSVLRTRRSSATACTAMASPRPIASTPSLVLPLTLTRARRYPAPRPAAPDRLHVRRELRPLEDHDASTFADTRSRASRRCATARAQQLEARRHPSTADRCRESAGRCRPRRGAEQRVGHRMADDVGVRMPERPRSNGIVTPPRTSGRPCDQPMQIVADADARARAPRPPACVRRRGPRRW